MRFSHGFSVASVIPILTLIAPSVARADLSVAAPEAGAPSASTLTYGTLFDRTNTLTILGLGLGAILSTNTRDVNMARFVDGSPLDGAIDIANTYGDGLVLGGVAIGLLALGRATAEERVATVGGELTTSLVAAWSVTWALKLSVNAKRPNGGRHSFPSGHTTTAFAAAPVIHRHFGDVAGGFAYGVAAMTGMARMEDHKHYLADVCVGAAIGIVAGRSFSRTSDLRLVVPARSTGLGISLGF